MMYGLLVVMKMKGPMLVDELLVAVTQCLGGLEELETLRLGEEGQGPSEQL